METAETNATLTEQELVEHWRSSELERAGYPPDVAAELAARSDIDLHGAAELLQRGLHARARRLDPALGRRRTGPASPGQVG